VYLDVQEKFILKKACRKKCRPGGLQSAGGSGGEVTGPKKTRLPREKRKNGTVGVIQRKTKTLVTGASHQAKGLGNRAEKSNLRRKSVKRYRGRRSHSSATGRIGSRNSADAKDRAVILKNRLEERVAVVWGHKTNRPWVGFSALRSEGSHLVWH